LKKLTIIANGCQYLVCDVQDILYTFQDIETASISILEYLSIWVLTEIEWSGGSMIDGIPYQTT